jgi:hypothetical protein
LITTRAIDATIEFDSNGQLDLPQVRYLPIHAGKRTVK